jgi:hypothetical protein
VRDYIELLWLKARQGALDQPAIVDGSHLVDQRVRILLEATGRSNANPKRLGGLDEPGSSLKPRHPPRFSPRSGNA